MLAGRENWTNEFILRAASASSQLWRSYLTACLNKTSALFYGSKNIDKKAFQGKQMSSVISCCDISRAPLVQQIQHTTVYSRQTTKKVL